MDNNATAEQILKKVGDKKVKYGEVVEEDEMGVGVAKLQIVEGGEGEGAYVWECFVAGA